MANLKEIRNRITSVGSTMQITSAMKMVSAAKLKRAQDAITQMRPYANKLTELLVNLSSSLDTSEGGEFSSDRPQRKILLVAITSNRGLCGGFNANIIKKINLLIEKDYKESQVSILSIGKKSSEYFNNNNFSVVSTHDDVFSDLKYDSINGYSSAVQDKMPHAWKSGTQVQLLRNQVMNMKQGGTFVMVPPPNPYRCPPGPYERVSMIAHQFKQSNPTAKIVILDPKPKFSKQGLFEAGWQKHYPGMIEWISSEDHGGLKNVNASTMEFETDLDTFKADAACVVPAQKAGAIAMAAGVNNGDWCPIVPTSMQSQADENIYVLGDASVAKSMPKSGFSANSQAKVAANHIRGALTGSKVFDARYSNTCWSLIAPDDDVKVGASYVAGAEAIDVESKFISQADDSSDTRAANYQESIDWYNGITADMFS